MWYMLWLTTIMSPFNFPKKWKCENCKQFSDYKVLYFQIFFYIFKVCGAVAHNILCISIFLGLKTPTNILAHLKLLIGIECRQRNGRWSPFARMPSEHEFKSNLPSKGLWHAGQYKRTADCRFQAQPEFRLQSINSCPMHLPISTYPSYSHQHPFCSLAHERS